VAETYILHGGFNHSTPPGIVFTELRPNLVVVSIANALSSDSKEDTDGKNVARGQNFKVNESRLGRLKRSGSARDQFPKDFWHVCLATVSP
jgi:hypothetical protein